MQQSYDSGPANCERTAANLSHNTRCHCSVRDAPWPVVHFNGLADVTSIIPNNCDRQARVRHKRSIKVQY
jgi:hypothetical protein